jgi:hypothetical protein
MIWSISTSATCTAVTYWYHAAATTASTTNVSSTTAMTATATTAAAAAAGHANVYTHCGILLMHRSTHMQSKLNLYYSSTSILPMRCAMMC